MAFTHTYRAPDVDDRLPAHFLNYSGHVVPDCHAPMGPNTRGETLWPVTAEYDEAADKTRVGLTYTAPPDQPFTISDVLS